MQSIKRVFILAIIATLTLSVSNCKSTTEPAEAFEIVDEVPFTITKAAFQEWVAGTPEGGSGTNVFINVDALADGIKIRDLFFRNMVSRARIVPPLATEMTGYFRNNASRDTVMDVDPKKEAQNTPPKKFPLPLEKNQAGISYMDNGELKYYVIAEMTELEAIAYPASNRLSDDN